MPRRADMREAALLLRFREGGRDHFEDRKMLVNVSFSVLHRDRPLLIPPIRLSEDAAIDHGEPIVAPEIDVDLGPVTVIANLLRIEHQRAVDTGAGDVGLQTGFLDDGAIAIREFFAEIA